MEGDSRCSGRFDLVSNPQGEGHRAGDLCQPRTSSLFIGGILQNGEQREPDGLRYIIELHEDVPDATAEGAVGPLLDRFGDGIGKEAEVWGHGGTVIAQSEPSGEGKFAGRVGLPALRSAA
jgi:hypothetical protein